MTDQAASPLLPDYRAVRALTVELCRPLTAEDMLVQSMPQASPAKWHLAHTTWFFETFVLGERLPGYRRFDERYSYLFNSYYDAVGERVERSRRGLLSRPGIEDVFAYRAHVDEAMRAWPADGAIEALVVLGLNHEQQHQELLLTDIKHAFATNPLQPTYLARGEDEARHPVPPSVPIEHPGGLVEIGHAGTAFAYDNEGPHHHVYLRPFRLAARLVTCGDYLDFIESGGYERPGWWLADGWEARRRMNWEAPLYWEKSGSQWRHYTLAGPRAVRPDEPVAHVSYYEADAFARWAGARLPTEAEWEAVAAGRPLAGSFLDAWSFHPAEAGAWFGEAWQWTASPYAAYPGYRPLGGALGEDNGHPSSGISPTTRGQALLGLSEYNAKFFINQMVLRGGSCLTPRSHTRVTYRNFFPPETRWQMSGIRLAWDA